MVKWAHKIQKLLIYNYVENIIKKKYTLVFIEIEIEIRNKHNKYSHQFKYKIDFVSMSLWWTQKKIQTFLNTRVKYKMITVKYAT